MSPATRLQLSRKAKIRSDPLTGETLLLYPEHGLILNQSAAAIVRLCDGREIREIASALDAPLPDVLTFLQTLADRGLVKETS